MLITYFDVIHTIWQTVARPLSLDCLSISSLERDQILQPTTNCGASKYVRRSIRPLFIWKASQPTTTTPGHFIDYSLFSGGCDGDNNILLKSQARPGQGRADVVDFLRCLVVRSFIGSDNERSFKLYLIYSVHMLTLERQFGIKHRLV